jgi:hypothetical protein
MDANPTRAAHPLHAAARDENMAAVAELLAQGSDPNAADDSGETPLHLAARAGHRDIARLLLEAGADMTSRNATGQTARALASGAGYMGVVILLDMWAEAHHLPKEKAFEPSDQAGDQRAELVAALKRVWIPIVLVILAGGCLLIYLLSAAA